jgi:hypothetical protein
VKQWTWIDTWEVSQTFIYNLSNFPGPNHIVIAQIPLDFNNPKPWVLSRHIENLVSRIGSEPDKKARKTRDKNEIGDRHLRMSFAELQRMRLRELQCRLVKSIVDMRIDPRTPVDWEADLKEYSEQQAASREKGNWPLKLIDEQFRRSATMTS